MRDDRWLKVATGIWVLSALGGAIALAKGARVAGVVETVGPVWLLLAMLLGTRIARHFPQQRAEIAFGVAIMATALGVGSIFYYSTQHVAFSLVTVGIFWNMAADLLAGRNNDFLLDKSTADIYRYFKTTSEIQRSPLETVLDKGGTVLMLAAIVSLFTLTTW